MKRANSRAVPPGSASHAEPELDNSAPAAAGHGEWLLDESLRETFPASDPISPVVPPDEPQEAR